MANPSWVGCTMGLAGEGGGKGEERGRGRGGGGGGSKRPKIYFQLDSSKPRKFWTGGGVLLRGVGGAVTRRLLCSAKLWGGGDKI